MLENTTINKYKFVTAFIVIITLYTHKYTISYYSTTTTPSIGLSGEEVH